MYSWLVGRMIRRGYGQAIAGDPKMLLSIAADDIEFVFPGHSAFAGSLHGKEPLEAWMRRYASLEPKFDIRDVLVSGPPWDLRIGVRFGDAIGDDYRNEGMEYLRLRWGKLKQLQVFLDTERVEAWEQRHPELVA